MKRTPLPSLYAPRLRTAIASKEPVAETPQCYAFVSATRPAAEIENNRLRSKVTSQYPETRRLSTFIPSPRNYGLATVYISRWSDSATTAHVSAQLVG